MSTHHILELKKVPRYERTEKGKSLVYRLLKGIAE
ncbi:hypothetical protein PPTG_25030 [Phytophthora nicotianae INRA-310]|uniref:Uncharacterized protein n=1 Tax=Phytophthora nicotianae (strain INRA-310) TaxID=761204 RepID=W2PAI8_PHYN3|nr:hypothetical protein PPTG_25030 [Phytophthora nicotianae INRA-310]ETM97248.1 hypothetical protein PPTG_25030 [Phytophthora nicotianae INRA-310]